MKTSEQILFMLKSQGDLSARLLAEQLKLTTMGVRQHLHGLEQAELIYFYDKKVKVGRPTRYWRLSAQGHARFPDSHSELSTQLLVAVQDTFGEQGLAELLDKRQSRNLDKYRSAISEGKAKSIPQRLTIFTELRSQEGYMASWEAIDNEYWFYENHCPICAAATQCQSLCDSELSILRILFADCRISRATHIVLGERRCAYHIQPRPERIL